MALLTLVLTSAVALAVATLLLVSFGHRLRVASRILGIVCAIVLAVAAGELAARVWNLPPEQVLAGQAAIVITCVLVALVLPRWNPIGQVFLGSYIGAAGTYLSFAAYVTFAGGFPPLGVHASALLLLLEMAALFLSASFVFEGCDVLCRVRWTRRIVTPDPSHLPMVSLQVPAYNEPPDMLIKTLGSLEELDYPNFEIIVIDNNTEDPQVWRPIEEYCRGRERIKFIHVEGLEGFKAGALNLVMREHIDPNAEVVGVIDADYLIDPDYLQRLVGYFVDPNVAFVQAPQDYREFEHDNYLTACYDGYMYFFATTMPSRNDRNSIIFAGTMGLIRRSVLEQIGGWAERFITEDAETSLRMLKAGYSGVYVDESLGRGIMPLTFSALKSQRYRWCFGGIQILKGHWRDLLPWSRGPDNRLTFRQKLDYFLLSVQWTNDLLHVAFALVLLVSAFLVLAGGGLHLRPLISAIVLLPAVLLGSGLIRALWSLRHLSGIGARRTVLTLVNWLSLSWTVALACVQGFVRSRAVFLRTPKEPERRRFIHVLRDARSELAIAGALWGAGIILVLTGRATPFLLALFIWQGCVFACAPSMAWLNLHTELTPELERKRFTDALRERLAAYGPFYVGGAAGVMAVALVAMVLAIGGAERGTRPDELFRIPQAENEQSPLSFLRDGLPNSDSTEEEPAEPAEGESPPTDEESPPPEESPAPEETTPAPEETASP